MADEAQQRPILQYSVNCDGFGQDETGKLVLVGIFELIRQPATLAQFFIVNCWTYGRGSFRETVKITKPDGDLLAEAEPVTFQLSHQSGRHTVASGFVNTTFPEPGVYWVQVSLDDELEIAWPLPVLKPENAG